MRNVFPCDDVIMVDNELLLTANDTKNECNFPDEKRITTCIRFKLGIICKHMKEAFYIQNKKNHDVSFTSAVLSQKHTLKFNNWHRNNAIKFCLNCDNLQWSHNERDGVSIYFQIIGVSVTGQFPAQRASKAENVSIWRRHHEMSEYLKCYEMLRDVVRYFEWNKLVHKNHWKPMS